MAKQRINFNLSIAEAETILSILKDYGDAYTHNTPRHTEYDNSMVTAKLQRMVRTRKAKQLLTK